MKVITLEHDEVIDGRLRRKGEVLSVPDTFTNVDKVIKEEKEEKNATK